MRYIQSMLIVLLLSSVYFINTTTNVSGIEYSTVNYWFYVDEPTTLNHSDMFFTIYNHAEIPINANCSFKTIENLDLEILLDWNNITIQPDSDARNYYQIVINEIFSGTFDLEIICKTSAIDSKTSDGANTETAGSIKTRITFYGENDGSLLDLKIVDQSNTPLYADVIIKYKENNSLSYTTIKEFTGNNYRGVLPNGLYLVQAIEHESGIIGQTTFELAYSIKIYLELELVGFDQYRIIFDEETRQLGINTTINNYVGILLDVEIYAQLVNDDGVIIAQTNIAYRSEFHKTTGSRVVLYFPPKNLEKARYTINNYIIASGILIATKSESFKFGGSQLPDSLSTVEKIIQFIDQSLSATNLIFILILIYLGKTQISKAKIYLQNKRISKE